MVAIRELGLGLRVFMRTYRWRVVRDAPRARLRRPLAECRVALVSSAGLVVPGDPPFDERVRGGDFSHRVVPAGVDVQQLEEHHRSDSFDHAGIEADRNLALPLDRLHQLESEGAIGEVAPHHLSLMGSITAPGRLLARTIPRIVETLLEDRVEVALLVPV